jgi:hypothetical protein
MSKFSGDLHMHYFFHLLIDGSNNIPVFLSFDKIFAREKNIDDYS